MRKTLAQRREEFERERARLYPEFVKQVRAVETYAAMKAFVQSEIPPPDTPGRIHFTNLIHFLGTGTRPGEATDAEWALYQELAKRIGATQ